VIVVDLGCADRGEWFSLEALADEYHPDIIYGFDPSPLLNTRRRKANGVPVKLERKAAWTFDGTVEFVDDFMRGGLPGPIGYGTTCAGSETSLGRVGAMVKENEKHCTLDLLQEGKPVPCFDFSRWLIEHVGPEQCVVKMDIEGAEYNLLEHLIRQGTHKLVTELVVEWHEQPAPHLTKRFGKVREWWM
jgi:FkbM family methyltransferase